jgi:hypothetical protein
VVCQLTGRTNVRRIDVEDGRGTYRETGEQLFGELVGYGLALVALVVLKCLEARESGTSSNQLVAKRRLVLLEVVVLVDLLVGLLRIAPSERHVGNV